MCKKSIPIITVGLSAVVAMLVLGYAVFVKPKTCTPVQKPVVSNGENKTSVTPAPTPAPTPDNTPEIDTSDWLAYRNEEFGFQIKYPQGWIYKEYDDTIYFGTPESKSGGYIWGISIYQPSELEKIIMQTGNQFADRKETREKIKMDKNVSGILVTVTTNKHTDWISKKVYFEKNDQLFAIGNGAIDDNRFKAFYKSFEFAD